MFIPLFPPFSNLKMKAFNTQEQTRASYWVLHYLSFICLAFVLK